MLDRPFVDKRVHALLQLCLFFRRFRPGRPRWPQRSVEIQSEKKVAESANDCQIVSSMLAKALCQFFIRIVWIAAAQPEQQLVRLVRPLCVQGHNSGSKALCTKLIITDVRFGSLADTSLNGCDVLLYPQKRASAE